MRVTSLWLFYLDGEDQGLESSQIRVGFSLGRSSRLPGRDLRGRVLVCLKDSISNEPSLGWDSRSYPRSCFRHVSTTDSKDVKTRGELACCNHYIYSVSESSQCIDRVGMNAPIFSSGGFRIGFWYWRCHGANAERKGNDWESDLHLCDDDIRI
jgi:hypothetical protein